jgi:hypothetical protein
MVLPPELRERLARVLETSRPLGDHRVQSLLRDATLRIAAQVISEMEIQVDFELEAERRRRSRTKPRVVTAGSILPEFGG